MAGTISRHPERAGKGGTAVTKEELKRAYTERLPVIWHSHRDEIEYKYIHELRTKESRSGKRVLYAVLADYCGHSYTVADPRQLSIKNP